MTAGFDWGDHPDWRQRLEAGQRRLFFRAGMWRGPELTEEQRANLRERVWGGGADGAIPA